MVCDPDRHTHSSHHPQFFSWVPFSLITCQVCAVFPLHVLVLMAEQDNLTSLMKQDIICGLMHIHRHNMSVYTYKTEKHTIAIFSYNTNRLMHTRVCTYFLFSIISLFFKHVKHLHWDMSAAERDKSKLTPFNIFREK